MKLFEKAQDKNRIIIYLCGKKIFSRRKKKLTNKSKYEILNTAKPNIFRFFKNLKYLFLYDLKQMHNNPNINIPEITEFAAIKIKFIWDEIKVPKIMNAEKTVSELLNSDKSIIRFGDGEMSLMLGEGIPFEKGNNKIQKSLKQIFQSDSPNLLIGAYDISYRLPLNIVWNNPHEYLYGFIKRYYKKYSELFNYEKTYYSSCFAAPFMYADWDCDKQFASIRKIWDNKKVTIICGDRVFNKIKYNVVDNASDVSYIYGPTIGAFEKYDELKERVSSAPKDNILIFALGPCGKILAYDAFNAGYRVLDMGHLIKNYDFYKRYPEMTEQEFYNEFKAFYKPDTPISANHNVHK